MVTGDLIEFVAMDQQITAAIGGGVDCLQDHMVVAEAASDIFTQCLAVVARDQDDAGAPRQSGIMVSE